MARLKLGAIITDVSGKLGGQQLGRHNGTVILQNKSVTNKTGTNAQMLHRKTTKRLMSQWSTIGDDNRRLWYLQLDDYKELNNFSDTKKFNGFTLFQKLNQGRLQCGLSTLKKPNPVHKPTIPQEINHTIDVSEFTLQSSLYQTDDIISIYATKQLSKGISNAKKYLRFITNLTATQLNTGIDILAAYEAKFGSLVDDTKIFIANKTYSAISGYSNGVLLANKQPIIVGGITPPAYDPDAQAFIDAIGTLTLAQKEAINNLVLGLKSNGTWLKYKAIYPFIGGTASAHKFNLINPVNTDAAFRLVFNGSWVHDSNGAKANGVNGWAQTFINISNEYVVVANEIDINFGYYSNLAVTGNSNKNEFANWGNAVGTIYYINMSNGTVATGSCGVGLVNITGSSSLYTKYANWSALNGVSKYFENGVSINSYAQITPSTYNEYMTLNAAGLSSSNSVQSGTYSDARCALASIGIGLTDTECLNDYNVIQTFQTALGRNN